jgi:hypothetical protein
LIVSPSPIQRPSGFIARRSPSSIMQPLTGQTSARSRSISSSEASAG